MNPAFTENWFLRCQDLIDKYHPDLVYFDNTGAAARPGRARHRRALLQRQPASERRQTRSRAVTAKKMTAGTARRSSRTSSAASPPRSGPQPWQTDTCIGYWHYDRDTCEQHRYKTVGQVVHMLVDIVSKNGNLLLSIPVRGDGTIDEDEVAFLEGMAKWMDVNGEGIFGTRPWKVYGEGPSVRGHAGGHVRRERDVRSYTAEDVRFTTKGDTLYAFLLGWPGEKNAVIKSLATNSPQVAGQKITDVSLLGYKGKLEWSQDEQGLTVKMPDKPPSDHAVALKIKGILTT